MCAQDNNVKRTIENPVAIAAPASVYGGKNFGALGNAEENHEEATPLSEDAMKIYEHLIGVHVAYFRACNVPYMTTCRSLPQQVVQEQNTQRAHDSQVSNYGDNLVEADTSTTAVQQQRVPSAGSAHVQHYGASGLNNTIPSIHQEQTVAPVTKPSLRLMHIKGQVAASCADANGSRFVQQAIQVATPQEIVMVYEEIMPCVRTLAADVFGNHAVQKILEHGPQSCKRELISRLMGHVLPLSHDMYGCRVIQKALDVGEHNQKIVIVKELKHKVLKCVRDQFASHVIQKCVECLPPKHIQFIFRSFCGWAKALSMHPYGSRVIQKVLAHCDNAEVCHTLTAEIIEFANKLSADPFGNYVVQHLLEHGGQTQRSMIVRKFDRRVVSLCYHKFASNVLEKCLVFGSQEDRQLIINEILGNAGSQHVEHLVDMMINPYANFVIQKMVVTAEEQQVGLLLDVARKNADSLKRYPHGRHFIAAIEKFLSANEGSPVHLVNNE
ncbi:hypothetical protein BDA96_05G244300 [Sorghum bicolor]|uniref:PUM-HD domain-containing protein n=3 Tax=Sorghum bicolor TaxID=4558 RepID=A0A921R115_SORBI|nr:hypothetical protein BDA96_05G244300 [Sorghum bicolor]